MGLLYYHGIEIAGTYSQICKLIVVAALVLLCINKFGSCQRKNGAITALIRKERSTDKYEKHLILRNKAILQYLYWEPTSASKVDIILFHDGTLPSSHQDYIKLATPSLPIAFVDVSKVFKEFKAVNISQCPTNSFVRYMFSPGYHSMCYFWFIRFQKYVEQYDWLLRIDDDCILKRDVRHNIQLLPKNVHFASAFWVDLSKVASDTIRPGHEGSVVVGLRNLTIHYARQKQLFDSIHSWHAPYTNVMYIDLTWLRNNTIIQDYMKIVEESQCIYSNRWGDLPLWGAAIYLVSEPPYQLKIPYFHGTHSMLVNGSHTKANLESM